MSSGDAGKVPEMSPLVHSARVGWCRDSQKESNAIALLFRPSTSTQRCRHVVDLVARAGWDRWLSAI